MKVRKIEIIKSLGAFITAVAGVLVLIYIAFFSAVMNDSFLEKVNIRIGTHEKLGMSEEDLGKVARSMIYFTKGESDVLQVRVTMNGVERDFYNEKELLHIEDVRDLVREVRIFITVCGIVFVTGSIWAIWSKNVHKLAKGFLVGLGLVIVLAAVVGVIAVIDMQAVIYGFHNLFFDNDLWLLDSRTDMVIWLFSHEMYGSAIARIGMWLACLLVPFTVASVIVIKKHRKCIGKENAEV